MRPNIVLRRHCHYKPSLRSPLYWQFFSPMNLRRIFRRQRHPNPLLRLPLPLSLHYCSCNNSSPYFSPRNRIQQPHRPKLRCRQNLFPPLLLLQRLTRLRNSFNRPHLSRPLLSQPARRPRQLYPCKPPSYPTSY